MANSRLRLLTALLCGLCLLDDSAQLSAADQLPERIPSLTITVREAIQKVVQTVTELEAAGERQRALTRVLYDLRALDAQTTSPVYALLDETFNGLANSQDLLHSVEVFSRVPPATILRVARQMQDAQARDRCLQHYVSGSVDRNLDDLLPLIHEIKDPLTRCKAWVSLLYGTRLDLKQAEFALREARQLGDVAAAAYNAHQLGLMIAPLAAKHPEGVAQLLAEVLKPNQAVAADAVASGYCEFKHNSPQASAQLLQIAAKLVPQCDDPADVTTTLLHHRLAKHHPNLALELFDKHVAGERVNSPDNVISYLWPAGMARMLERAERYCKEHGSSREWLIPSVIGRIASTEKPELAIQWLERTEPRRIRDEATVKISQGLVHYVHKRENERAKLVHWVDVLTKCTLAINDGQLRASGCERLSTLVGVIRVKPPIELPQSIRDEYLTLWPEIRTRLEAAKKWDLHHVRYDLAPRDVFDEALRQSFSKSETRFVAGLVHNSNLTAEEKAEWNAAILAQARAIPDLRKRAITLTGLAKLWRNGDPELSLQLALDGLRIAQRLGIKRVNGIEGIDEPYVTMEDTLRFGVERLPTNENSVQSLWKLASRLDAMDERDAVLEALVGVLLRSKDTDRAAGVSKLVGDPARRARAWGAVAVVTSGKPLRVDW
jgi:hypothetical protein